MKQIEQFTFDGLGLADRFEFDDKSFMDGVLKDAESMVGERAVIGFAPRPSKEEYDLDFATESGLCGLDFGLEEGCVDYSI